MENSALIGAQECPRCLTCGAEGKALYNSLEDVLFEVPGKWSVKRCSNDSCGMLWLDPMPRAEELYKAYKNYSTHHDLVVKSGFVSTLLRRVFAGYRAKRFGYNTAGITCIDRLLGMLAGLLPPLRLQMEFPFIHFRGVPVGRLLEVGCGGGESLKMFNRWGWTTEGVDFDEAAVANARAKGLTVYLGDLFSRNYEANSFDAIYSSHVLEHVPHPEALLVECHRLLKPGGRCVILTPNADSIGHRLYGSSWRGLEPPRHLHIFTRGSLEKMVHSAGFTRTQITTSSRLAGAMYIQSTLMSRHGRLDSRAPIDVKFRVIIIHFLAYIYRRVSCHSGEEIIFFGHKSE